MRKPLICSFVSMSFVETCVTIPSRFVQEPLPGVNQIPCRLTAIAYCESVFPLADVLCCPHDKAARTCLAAGRTIAGGRANAAAGALLDYVKHMRELRLTDAQVAEVRRRLANPDRKLVSHAEARERIARLGS